jgi:hypothetical protein
MKNLIKLFIATIFDLKLLCIFFLIAVAAFTWANHTQVAIYSQDIPNNMICIKDTVPDAYLCSPDATVPWYLSTEGVLANVQ